VEGKPNEAVPSFDFGDTMNKGGKKTLSRWKEEFTGALAKRQRGRGTTSSYVVLAILCPQCGKKIWTRPSNLRRQQRDGIPLGRCGSCAQNKGGWINGDGYHLVLYRGKTTPRARIVLAQKLGRSLLRREEAHHLNLNRGDDKPENLIPKLKSNHGRGITPNDAAQWLRSIPGWTVVFRRPQCR
jgi:hypothetical protein